MALNTITLTLKAIIFQSSFGKYYNTIDVYNFGVLNPGIVENMYVYPKLNCIVEIIGDQYYSSTLPARVYIFTLQLVLH